MHLAAAGILFRSQLSLSDIVIADTLVPLTNAPATRAELRLVPKRRLVTGPGQAIHAYFEVYGLQADSSGLRRYEAELAVEDSPPRSLVESMVRAVGKLMGRGGEPTRIRWQRIVPAHGDRIIDFLRVDLGRLEPGEYALRIRVTDQLTRDRAETARRFSVLRVP